MPNPAWSDKQENSEPLDYFKLFWPTVVVRINHEQKTLLISKGKCWRSSVEVYGYIPM